MKAKKVYEFKRTRKQGLSKQTEIGLNYYEKPAIIDWFKEWEPDWKEGDEYIINNDLSIMVWNSFFLMDKPIKEIPFDNMEMIHDLNLTRTLITKLPNNLYVNGFLSLKNTPISELPKNLKVGRGLDISNTLITKIPEDIIIYGAIIINKNNPNLIISDKLKHQIIFNNNES